MEIKSDQNHFIYESPADLSQDFKSLNIIDIINNTIPNEYPGYCSFITPIPDKETKETTCKTYYYPAYNNPKSCAVYKDREMLGDFVKSYNDDLKRFFFDPAFVKESEITENSYLWPRDVKLKYRIHADSRFKNYIRQNCSKQDKNSYVDNSLTFYTKRYKGAYVPSYILKGYSLQDMYGMSQEDLIKNNFRKISPMRKKGIDECRSVEAGTTYSFRNFLVVDIDEEIAHSQEELSDILEVITEAFEINNLPGPNVGAITSMASGHVQLYWILDMPFVNLGWSGKDFIERDGRIVQIPSHDYYAFRSINRGLTLAFNEMLGDFTSPYGGKLIADPCFRGLWIKNPWSDPEKTGIISYTRTKEPASRLTFENFFAEEISREIDKEVNKRQNYISSIVNNRIKKDNNSFIENNKYNKNIELENFEVNNSYSSVEPNNNKNFKVNKIRKPKNAYDISTSTNLENSFFAFVNDYKIETGNSLIDKNAKSVKYWILDKSYRFYNSKSTISRHIACIESVPSILFAIIKRSAQITLTLTSDLVGLVIDIVGKYTGKGPICDSKEINNIVTSCYNFALSNFSREGTSIFTKENSEEGNYINRCMRIARNLLALLCQYQGNVSTKTLINHGIDFGIARSKNTIRSYLADSSNNKSLILKYADEVKKFRKYISNKYASITVNCNSPKVIINMKSKIKSQFEFAIEVYTLFEYVYLGKTSSKANEVYKKYFGKLPKETSLKDFVANLNAEGRLLLNNKKHTDQNQIFILSEYCMFKQESKAA